MKQFQYKKTFLITWTITFLIGIFAIPIVIHSDRRILQELNDLEFIVVGLGVSFIYSIFLSLMAVTGTYLYMKKTLTKSIVETANPPRSLKKKE